MAYRVTQEDILSLRTDAAALSVEISLEISPFPVCQTLAAAGGETLRAAVREKRFLPVGSAVEIDRSGLGFAHVFAAAAPIWLTGKANELLTLHRTYESLFTAAAEAGCRSIALPFLSAMAYRFPRDEAVHAALREAERSGLELLFAAETDELYEQSLRPYRRPGIVSYVGYYRDSAVFLLDNGQYARVDLRPERRAFDVVPYIEACFREGTDPAQPPLGEAEKARLREVYENSDY